MTRLSVPVPDDYQSFERRLDRTNLVVVGAGVVAAAVFHSPGGALSLAVGGAVSYVNFRWLKQAINYLISKGGQAPVGRRVGLQYIGRYALIGLALFVTIRFAFLDVALLFAGLFSYVLAVLLECIFEIADALIREDPNGRT